MRNFLMMGADGDTQEKLYNDYWQRIKEWLKDEKFIQEFLNDYLRIYFGVSLKDKDTYESFKKHSKEKFDDDKECVMADLTKFARIYCAFNEKFMDFRFERFTNPSNERQIREKIKIMMELKFGVSKPFLMRLIDDQVMILLKF